MNIDENDDVTNMALDGDNNPNTNHGSNSSYPCRAVDNLLSRDLMELSSRDRCLISEEVHGVESLAVEENDDEITKKRISKALFELDQVLEHEISIYEKRSFVHAQSLQDIRGTYVNDVDFRMKFLRCKLFDVRKAARLMLNYLDLVQELYGDICLSRPIRLEDVQTTKEEKAAFRSGCLQLLPFGDRAGRRILMISTDALLFSTLIRVRMHARRANGL